MKKFDFKEIFNTLRTKRGLLIVAAIIYLVSPIDIIPEFIFPFGLVDDTVVLVFLIREIISLIHEYKSKKPVAAKKRNDEVIEGEIIG